MQSAIASVLNYFAGNNDEQRNILNARTVPFALQPSGNGFVSHLEVSPTLFPDDFLIPRPLPNTGVTKSLVNDNVDLIASFAFNTTGFPYLEDVQEACGVLQNSTLPPGYAINTSNSWSPTYVFYSGENSATFTSECWVAVYAITA